MSEHAEEGHVSYTKIYYILLALLVVSIIGPELGIRAVTLFTAFGIAIIKAYLVLKYFMHVTLEPKYVAYMVTTVLVFCFLFFAGVAPDVMKSSGHNWEKPAWVADDLKHAGGAGSAAADH